MRTAVLPLSTVRQSTGLLAEHAVRLALDEANNPAHEHEQLFSRFFRSSLAQERAIPGSGLGLSIAHAIVDMHGGDVVVMSEPGVGTTFRVQLPAAS